MSAARPDPLAGWRAARAARVAEAAAVASTVATVATAFPVVATPREAQETADVATVATVSSEIGKERIASAQRDAGGLTEAEKAETLARLFGTQSRAAWPAADPSTMDHDEAERAAMAAHYATPAEQTPYQPSDPDPLRDGLAQGFRAHRPALGAQRPAPETDDVDEVTQ